MNKQKLIELLEHPENLPERAYTTLPSDPTEVIIVVNGESGYYHYQKYPTAELSEISDSRTRKRNVRLLERNV